VKKLLATFTLAGVALTGTSYLYAQNTADALSDPPATDQDRRDTMMMDGCRMMSSRIEDASPKGMLALKDELDLSEDQAEQLRQIAEEARERSRQVLSAEQRERLAELEDQPSAMSKMMQQCQRWISDNADRRWMMQRPTNETTTSKPVAQPSDAMSCCWR
jgi:hypothetical protein